MQFHYRWLHRQRACRGISVRPVLVFTIILSIVWAFLLIRVTPADAAAPNAAPLAAWSQSALANNAQWWRNSATLDLDFVRDRYYLNGTVYSGIANFAGCNVSCPVTGVTFSRSGTTNVTQTGAPFHLDSTQGQTFVSRASNTASVTTSVAPFYLDSTQGQIFSSRSTVATYFDSTGTLQTTTSIAPARSATYSYNGAAWVANSGTLVEAAATNSVKNNTMSGGAAPSTLPTLWSSVGSLNGLTATYAYGTENGISYIDYTLTGTASASGQAGLIFAGNASGAAQGQTWSVSFYLKASGGTLTNISFVQADIDEKNASSVFVGGGAAGCATPPTLALGTTRCSYSRTLSNGSTAFITPYFMIGYNAGSVNFTVRIGMPQLEQSPAPTSVIATSTATVTRAADIFTQETASYIDGTGSLKFSAASTARDDHNPTSPYADLGTLAEPAATNSLRDNTMQGAAAADGIERTTSGTFTSCTGSTCTGWTTNLNGGTGSVSYSSNTATLTGDGTNSASIYQAIPTVSGYEYTIVVTVAAGNAVTVQAGTASGGATLLAASSAPAGTTTSYQFQATGTISYIQINNASTTPANVTSLSVQSAGNFSTYWFDGGGFGVLEKVVGIGTSGGINYMDVRFYGTPISNQSGSLNFEQNTQISASQGQVWTASVYVALVGGSLTNVSDVDIAVQEIASGTQVAFGQQALSATSTLTRYNYVYTLTNASSTSVRPKFLIDFKNGAAIDATFRIGMPQMEKSSFATSVIPTFGAIASRNADVYSVPNGGTYFNSAGVLQTALPNTPRLDYGASGGNFPKGILIEEGRTNSITNNTMQGAVAGTPGTLPTNWRVATCSGLTSSVIGTGTESGISYIDIQYSGTTTAQCIATILFTPNYSAITATAGQIWSLSGYVKLQGGSWGAYQQSPRWEQNEYDSSGANVAQSSSAFSPVPSGAALNTQYYSQVYTIAGATTAYVVPFFQVIYPTSTAVNFTVRIGMPQYENTGGNGNPTSVIATYGSAVARATDQFYVLSTANGGWFTNNIGTLGTVGNVSYIALNTQAFAGIDDGTVNNAVYTRLNGSSKRGYSICVSNTCTGTNYNTSYVAGNYTKSVLAFSTAGAGDQGFAADGNLLADGVSALPTTQNRLLIGHSRNVNGDLDGYLQRVWYMPTRQPDYSLSDYSR